MKEYIYEEHGVRIVTVGELIRCKDCRHRPTEIEEDGETYIEFPEDSRCPCRCEDHYYNWMPADDWFCGNGEREKK